MEIDKLSNLLPGIFSLILRISRREFRQAVNCDGCVKNFRAVLRKFVILEKRRT